MAGLTGQSRFSNPEKKSEGARRLRQATRTLTGAVPKTGIQGVKGRVSDGLVIMDLLFGTMSVFLVRADPFQIRKDLPYMESLPSFTKEYGPVEGNRIESRVMVLF